MTNGGDPDEDLNQSLELPSPLRNKSPTNDGRMYAQLDQALSGLPRQDFITELTKQTDNDLYMLLLYRDYLAEEARKFPECPKSRLVNRRNSARSRKEVKLAEDCYILYAFIEGSQSSEVFDLFLSQDSLNSSYIACAQLPRSTQPNPEDTRVKFEAPDITAMIVKLQSDVSQILQKREEDRVILNDIRSDVSAITTNVRVIQVSVNGIRSTMNSDQSNSERVEKVQSDLRNVSATLASINKKICDTSVIQIISEATASGSGSSEGSKRAADSSANGDMTVLRHPPGRGKPLSDEERKNSFSQTVGPQSAAKESSNRSKSVPGLNKNGKPSASATLPSKEKSNSTSGFEQGHVTIDIAPTDSPSGENGNNTGFVAVRRKRISTFYIGNIDTSVTANDIYSYLDDRGVKATSVRLIPNKYSVSARVNIPTESDSVALDNTFWPEKIVVRRWMSQNEWAKERKNGYQMKNGRGNNQKGRFDQSDYDYNEDSEYYSGPSYGRRDQRSYESANDHRAPKYDWYSNGRNPQRQRWFDSADDDGEGNFDYN